MMLGSMPPVEQWLSHWPRGNEMMWTPAEWAWIAGLYDALFPAWFYGTPVLAHRFAKFDPERAFAMLEPSTGSASAFIPPTALKMMRQVSKPRERWGYDMRAISTGGEAMGEELLDWGRDTFGTTISEGYGQTEMNLMLLNSPDWFEVRPGSCGRACPGRKVAIVDSARQPSCRPARKARSPAGGTIPSSCWSTGATPRPRRRSSPATGC